MRTTLSLALLVVCLLLSTPASAQHESGLEAKIPPPLARFTALLGHWEGSGTVQMPGMPVAQEWTSVLTTEPVLGNQFIRTEMRIDMKGSSPLTMIYCSYYGWDAKKEEIVAYSIGNTGEIETSHQVLWLDDKTLLLEGMHVEAGVPQMHRTVNRYTEDTYSFTWEVAYGDQPMTVLAKGTYTRAEEGFSISAGQWANHMVAAAPTPPQMKKLSGMAGEYTMTGKATMVPGMPAMDISGRETVTPIFGGTVLRQRVVGDPIPGAGDFRYEAIAYLGYVPHEGVYRQFYITNMGEVGHEDLHFVDDHTLVHVSTAVENGKPVVTRGVIELNADGHLVRSTNEQLRGSGSIERTFEGEWVRQAD